jgi:hypothetical protein
MVNSSEQGANKMNNGKSDSTYNKIESGENEQLKSLLQKAVNTEKAPDSLRAKISKMIREK